MYDIGDTWAGQIAIYDETGQLADATVVELVIALPDGSAAAPPVSSTSTGIYEATYAILQPGRHVLTWTATGQNAGVHTDTFDVASTVPILGLDDARSWLGVTKDSEQEELRAMLDTVSDLCERHFRRVWRRTVVTGEVHDGGGVVRLRATPVISVSEVRVDGIATTEYVLDRYRRVLYRGTSASQWPWPGGLSAIEVDYVAGPADGVVPAHVLHGCRLLASWLWQTQRGGSGLPRRAGADDQLDIAASMVPQRVRQAWGTPRVLVR